MREVFKRSIRGLKNWIVVILSLSFLLCFALYSEAGMVYGRVFGAEGVFQPGDSFVLIDGQGGRREVRTDQDKGYSIILPQGTYRVEFNKNGNIWEGWIESFPSSIRQDINLTPRKKAR